jgi:hypothetical protein
LSLKASIPFYNGIVSSDNSNSSAVNLSDTLLSFKNPTALQKDNPFLVGFNKLLSFNASKFVLNNGKNVNTNLLKSFSFTKATFGKVNISAKVGYFRYSNPNLIFNKNQLNTLKPLSRFNLYFNINSIYTAYKSHNWGSFTGICRAGLLDGSGYYASNGVFFTKLRNGRLYLNLNLYLNSLNLLNKVPVLLADTDFKRWDSLNLLGGLVKTPSAYFNFKKLFYLFSTQSNHYLTTYQQSYAGADYLSLYPTPVTNNNLRVGSLFNQLVHTN